MALKPGVCYHTDLCICILFSSRTQSPPQLWLKVYLLEHPLFQSLIIQEDVPYGGYGVSKAKG